jgi:hypothetical protein
MWDVKVEPGFVGASRNLPGVFILDDAGMCYPGVKKPYFEEYFLDMERFKGRAIKRLVPVGEEWEEKPGAPITWQYWTDVRDQTPYILSRRARLQKDFLPPKGQSALPPWWEDEIPKEFRWWEGDLSEKERLRRMDLAYNFLIEKGKLRGRKIPIKEARTRSGKVGRFALKRVWWRGQLVVRGMPVEHYYLFLDFPPLLTVLHFERNPILEKQAGLEIELEEKPPERERMRDWIDFEGELPPNSELNPNKELAARMETIDKGKVEWIADQELFSSFRFRGKLLKGYFTFKREEPGGALGIFGKSALPGEIRRS